MGLNNNGYSIHINLSKDEFQAFKELINVSPNNEIKNHVLKNKKLTKDAFINAGNRIWEDIKLAEAYKRQKKREI